MTICPPTTRLAPSPTGALHLGNARTFLINWALARQRNWRVLLRIDDLDGPRVKSGADRGAIRDLAWLGLDWDEGPVYQLSNLTPYQRSLDVLFQRGLIYPCTCTRREIESAQSAPHRDEYEVRYPGTCRWQRSQVGGQDHNHAKVWENRQCRAPIEGSIAWRLVVPDLAVTVVDELHGLERINVQQHVGDFVVCTKSGLPSYQLAVVVDDIRQGITEVVRGDDLLSSTARQNLLYEMFNQTERAAECKEHGCPYQSPSTTTALPRYWHLPLVVGPDGRRLAKRHGDSRISYYRDQGVAPERLLGLLAYYCALTRERKPMDAFEFLERFDIEKLPRESVVFTPEDDTWMMDR